MQYVMHETAWSLGENISLHLLGEVHNFSCLEGAAVPITGQKQSLTKDFSEEESEFGL